MAVANDLAAMIRASSRELEPLPTDTEPRAEPLPGLRAVLFDVYGTLFASGSGDISLARKQEGRARAVEEALRGAGLETDPEAGADGAAFLLKTIEAHHAERRREGIGAPEVEIRRVWGEVLAELEIRRRIRRFAHPDTDTVADETILRVSVAYECAVNPVWPMPGLEPMLAALRGRGIALGIVSNAQFYTPLLFDAFLAGPAETFGFDPSLCIWSYRLLEAKPSERPYREAAAALAALGLRPEETLYVGNDMRNDIVPARAVGFRTALFAGDARSLRLREEDPVCAGCSPDRVLTALDQIPPMLA